MSHNEYLDPLSAREVDDRLRVHGLASAFEDAQGHRQAPLRIRDRQADAPFPHVETENTPHVTGL